jgi:small subunit ribosomal protein S8
MKDSISNLITVVKNGSRSGKDAVVVPHSKFVESVAAALARKGYVKPAKASSKTIGKTLEIGLIAGRITDAKRVSKPSKRLYKGYSEIHSVKQGYGSTFVSTPKGILSDDEARAQKLGGEVLFQIW